MNKIESLARAVAEKYPADPTTAGITLAFLPSRGMFYVSACRYHGSFGDQKQVVARAMHESLDTAIEAITEKITDDTE